MSEQDATQDTSTDALDKLKEHPSPDEIKKHAPTDDADESPEDNDRDDSWDPERAKRKISKVNSENKALRERATKAEEKAKTLDEVSRERDDLTAANLRLQVGYELGLPLSLAQRLQGSTREEMLADAEALVELVAPTKRPPTNRPTETLRGGGQPEREPEETDLAKLGARMFRR